jgi:trehalose 6-phosphate synthase
VRRVIGFLVLLVLGLGLVAWGASVAVHRTARTWFEKDVTLRAQLAASGARQALIAGWRNPRHEKLESVLLEITHDERIMAAAACDDTLELLARTPQFPQEFTCHGIGKKLWSAKGGTPTIWASVFSLPDGELHVSAIPILEGGHPLGFVVLVHDLSFIEQREASTRRFFVVVFGMLALAASLVTILTARVAFRKWSRELLQLLRGGAASAEFRPLVRDLRDLMDTIVRDRDGGEQGGAWTPARLKQTLGRHLDDERIVIVANREPYIHQRAENGQIEVVHPASGLVTALEPIMRACSGVWIAHGAGTADREASDEKGHVRVPPSEEAYVIRRVWLTKEEEQGYYYGFANEGLWPLCHVAHARPTFRRQDYDHYRAVNEKFAAAVLDEVESDDPIILVQDYHFALVPRLIRRRLPRATVITFWHIPWPNSERFGICPWGKELLDGMLGASILGFHTRYHCNNFLESVDRFLEARIDREDDAVVQLGRSTLVRPYPISVEWPVRWLAQSPPVPECRAAVLAELGLSPDALLGVGVDRLDYTKGIEERLLSIERLLETAPRFWGRFTFVQLAAPSRIAIDRYRDLNESIEELAARINRRFADGAYRPIIVLREHHEPPRVFRFYRAAHLCYVSSLHDGMNLVAKEFVAARDDEQGVLVLSRFTGAARELPQALLVNPYDFEGASAALETALDMSVDEQRERMQALRALVAEFNVYRWAGRMLVDAARVRERGRVSGRLTGHAGRRVVGWS